MDGEEFFDRLYSRFHVHFPCYALLSEDGRGFAAEPAEDGTTALVLLTDDDLLEQYRDEQEGHYLPVTLSTSADLSRLLSRLPAGVTHVTFDPSGWFHRRFPTGLIRRIVVRAAKAG